MKKTFFKAILAMLFGIVIGIFSKWGDVIPGDNIIKYFGWISSGIIIWLVIGSILIIKAQDRKEFCILYSLFMISMLAAYYVFSKTVVNYLNSRIIMFWVAVFVGSLIIGTIIFGKRHTKLFRYLFILAATFFVVFDAIKINGIAIEAVIPEVLLSIICVILINKNIKV